jgi:acyl-CoA reductase-like NAD-dependent aldehyde dehydrogenase
VCSMIRAVHINSLTVHDEPTLPHGGWKSSGLGRFGGTSGYDEWLRTKSITWME